jgi:tight adherence protein C
MTSALLLTLFLSLSVAFFTLGLAVWTPTSVLATRIQSLLGRPLVEQKKPDVEGRLEQVLEPISKALPKSPEELSRVRLWLTQAGYREPQHVQMYFGLRGLIVIAALLAVGASGLLFRSPLWAVVALGLAYVLPRFVLKRMIKRRQLAIKLGLADALDLSVICVEAGLSVDQSLVRVANELQMVHPELSDELLLMNLELRAGKLRAEAFRNLAGRTGVDDVRALSAVLVQTDRFGTSVAQALRTHADSLRTERRQRAEEQAAKTGIKMTPVLVLFILPAIFIVVLGPAVLELIHNFLPALNK